MRKKLPARHLAGADEASYASGTEERQSRQMQAQFHSYR